MAHAIAPCSLCVSVLSLTVELVWETLLDCTVTLDIDELNKAEIRTNMMGGGTGREIEDA